MLLGVDIKAQMQLLGLLFYYNWVIGSKQYI